MNTPTVTIVNGSVPINGTVSIANTSVPVIGTLTVSNLPLDAEGNLRTSLAQQVPVKYEFKNIIGHFCPDPNTPNARYSIGLCLSQDAVKDVDPTLSNMSTQGWELIGVTHYYTPFGSGWTDAGIVYTFRRPL